jgi:hypothetical protein
MTAGTGIRISTKLDLSVGLDNDLSKRIFGGDSLLSELLDTLAKGESGTYRLDGGEQNVEIKFGDVIDCRYLYIEGDGEFEVVFGGSTPTAAIVDGVAGTYPTAFVGAETLDLEIDGVPFTTTFTVADQTRNEVLARINYAASLAGFQATPVALANGSQLRLKSPTLGASSVVKVLATSTPAVLTALGLVAGTTAGTNATPGTTNVRVFRPADPTGENAAFGVKSYLLATIKATSVHINNLMPTTGLNLKTFVGGDLVSLPC